jgi:hypothetical protein
MKALMVNGQFYESVRQFARENGLAYYSVAGAIREGKFPVWYLGYHINEATREQVTEFSGALPRPVRYRAPERPRVSANGKRMPLIPSPVTVGISTTWGVS